jgi:hypothetical protein
VFSGRQASKQAVAYSWHSPAWFFQAGQLLSLLYSLGSDHKENTLIVALALGTDHKENISAESAHCCHKE